MDMAMLVGGIFTMFDISASGLRAERARMNVHANNLANINTTRGEDGEPYRRRRVFFREGAPEITGSNTLGVSVDRVEKDYNIDFMYRWEPEHPDAVKEGKWAGYVAYPNVQAPVEMVDMMMASRAYEANLTTMDTAKQIHGGALRIIA
ncbi:MAG: flagellar basal body rod protein FlgC [Planctomycetota bacterium]|jgi:flagellar basal-body rod protein FlgC|nr:flagellar basal body rod protein FlgC [Planctomycetota bacterium]